LLDKLHLGNSTWVTHLLFTNNKGSKATGRKS